MFCIIVSSSHHVHILNFVVTNDTISSDVLKYVSDILWFPKNFAKWIILIGVSNRPKEIHYAQYRSMVRWQTTLVLHIYPIRMDIQPECTFITSLCTCCRNVSFIEQAFLDQLHHHSSQRLQRDFPTTVLQANAAQVHTGSRWRSALLFKLTSGSSLEDEVCCLTCMCQVGLSMYFLYISQSVSKSGEVFF